ncbi:MAG: hypothetical protein ACXWKP_24830, partial [Bradyrhizobium sp.]
MGSKSFKRNFDCSLQMTGIAFDCFPASIGPRFTGSLNLPMWDVDAWQSIPSPGMGAGRIGAHRTQKLDVKNMGGFVMRKVLVATCLVAVTAIGAGAAKANDELNKMSQNPKDWVMPT